MTLTLVLSQVRGRPAPPREDTMTPKTTPQLKPIPPHEPGWRWDCAYCCSPATQRLLPPYMGMACDRHGDTLLSEIKSLLNEER